MVYGHIMDTLPDTAGKEDLLDTIADTTSEYENEMYALTKVFSERYPQLSGLELRHDRSINRFGHDFRLRAYSPINGKAYQRMVFLGGTNLMGNSGSRFETIKEVIDTGLRELSMAIYGNAGGAGGSGGGSYGGVAGPVVFSQGSPISTLPIGWGPHIYNGRLQHITTSGCDIPAPSLSMEELEQQAREEKAEEKIENRRIEQAKKDFNLSELPEYEKKIMMDTLHEALNTHNYKKGVHNVTKGIYWLLFFLGFALMMNFGKILNIVELVVTQ